MHGGDKIEELMNNNIYVPAGTASVPSTSAAMPPPSPSPTKSQEFFPGQSNTLVPYTGKNTALIPYTGSTSALVPYKGNNNTRKTKLNNVSTSVAKNFPKLNRISPAMQSAASNKIDASMSGALSTTTHATVATVNLAAETADAVIDISRRGVGATHDIAAQAINSTKEASTHVLQGLGTTVASAANESTKILATAFKTGSEVVDEAGHIIGSIADTTGKVVDKSGQIIGSVADTSGKVVDNAGAIIGSASDFAKSLAAEGAKSGESISTDVLETSANVVKDTSLVSKEVVKQVADVTVSGLKLVGSSLSAGAKYMQNLVNRAREKHAKMSQMKMNANSQLLDQRNKQVLAKIIIDDFNKTASDFMKNIKSLYKLRLGYSKIIEKAFKQRNCLKAMFGRFKCGIEESGAFNQYENEMRLIETTLKESVFNSIESDIKSVELQIQTEAFKNTDLIEISNNIILQTLEKLSTHIERINMEFDKAYNILSEYKSAPVNTQEIAETPTTGGYTRRRTIKRKWGGKKTHRSRKTFRSRRSHRSHRSHRRGSLKKKF